MSCWGGCYESGSETYIRENEQGLVKTIPVKVRVAQSLDAAQSLVLSNDARRQELAKERSKLKTKLQQLNAKREKVVNDKTRITKQRNQLDEDLNKMAAYLDKLETEFRDIRDVRIHLQCVNMSETYLHTHGEHYPLTKEHSQTHTRLFAYF